GRRKNGIHRSSRRRVCAVVVRSRRVVSGPERRAPTQGGSTARVHDMPSVFWQEGPGTRVQTRRGEARGLRCAIRKWLIERIREDAGREFDPTVGRRRVCLEEETDLHVSGGVRVRAREARGASRKGAGFVRRLVAKIER